MNHLVLPLNNQSLHATVHSRISLIKTGKYVQSANFTQKFTLEVYGAYLCVMHTWEDEHYKLT